MSKIVLTSIGIIIVLFIAFKLWGIYLNYRLQYGYQSNIEKLEKQNNAIDSKLKELVPELEMLKGELKTYKVEKESIATKINTINSKLNTVKEKENENRQAYENAIKNINNDTADIYTRCIRTCRAAENLGREFTCPTNFCAQFSSSSSR